MISTNPEYSPFDLPVAEVREVWKFVHYITEMIPEESSNQILFSHIADIKNDLPELKKKLD